MRSELQHKAMWKQCLPSCNSQQCQDVIPNHGQKVRQYVVKWTNLEKRLSILPAGVVSKKLIGDRKIAKAILSCNFREAFPNHVSSASSKTRAILTYLDRAEDPQDKSLYYNEGSRTNPEAEIYTNVYTNIWIPTLSTIHF